jgi:hypothetical protein
MKLETTPTYWQMELPLQELSARNVYYSTLDKKTCKLPPRQFRTKFLQPCSTLRTPDEPINGSSENSTVNGTSEKPTVKAEPDQIYLYSKQRAARSGKREREDNRCLTGCGRRPCSRRACPRKHPGWS